MSRARRANATAIAPIDLGRRAGVGAASPAPSPLSWRSPAPYDSNRRAAVHVDGTARPQIVRDRDNPLCANIPHRFWAATGLPVLVNTSFNAHEEPIVNQPAECRRALRNRRVDFVVTEQSCYAL